MKNKLVAVIFIAASVGLAVAEPALPSRVLPGVQPDGFTVLHNQLRIQPAGKQIELGDFPTNMAVDRSGRWAAILHAGYNAHEVRLIDLKTGALLSRAPLHETFCGIGFSPDGETLYCSGGSDGVLHAFSTAGGVLKVAPDISVTTAERMGVVAGFALSADGKSAIVAFCYDNRVLRVDLAGGGIRWTANLGGEGGDVYPRKGQKGISPNDNLDEIYHLLHQPDPLHVVWDDHRDRAYVSLWGESSVAVLDTKNGSVVERIAVGLHPNELLLDGHGRLFVSNGGVNSVTVVDLKTGQVTETLSSAMAADDPPGSTPDSLALTPDGKTLFVANAYNDNVAVFDVENPGKGRSLGFIPTGWFPTSVRLTPKGRELLVLCSRGLTPKNNDGGSKEKFVKIDQLYNGSLGIVSLPKGDDFTPALNTWTRTSMQCRQNPALPPAGGPVPSKVGEASPIKHVIYIIKENRTYDQVLGDMPQGNGKASLCLFPEKITPNGHALARRFVLLDNFYANAEVSASGHEWSMAGYSSEFVERSWPIEYGHKKSFIYYPGEGHHEAAVPSLGYLWDAAARAGVSYRDYGEFTVDPKDPGEPAHVNIPSLKDHLDVDYRGWDLSYPDVKRAARFISELHRFETLGEMPRLQILRLPQDHTHGASVGTWTPNAMVADNDLALGQIVDAVSHSKFWPDTALFIVEDDAQNGPDHVDAHRTVAYVVSPYIRPGSVDSTAYTTCSMLRTIELILGISPMSQFDAGAASMAASFQAKPNLDPYETRPAQVDTDERNRKESKIAALSARLDFSKEDAIDDQVFNHVIWAAVRGEHDPMPAPIHAAFVRSLHGGGDGDDDDD